MAIIIKTKEEIQLMKESAGILSKVFQKTLKLVKSGVTTMELENFAREEIEKMGAKASFQTVENYKYATCMCINDCVVHGLPGNYVLKPGDILGIDMGALWKDYHSDASWSVIVDEEIIRKNPLEIRINQKRRFLDIGEEALWAAIKEAHVGNYIWDISAKIQEIVEKKGGYHVVHSLTGHGIGRELHEDPFIPGFISGKRENSPKIVDGMVLAIEIIYGASSGKVWYGGNDGWTISTRDGGLSGLFEATVAIVNGKPIILTHLA
jgi:methionyl aminopeptidase